MENYSIQLRLRKNERRSEKKVQRTAETEEIEQKRILKRILGRKTF